MGSSQLITIIGNLIDNAFEAVAEKEKRGILFMTDIGRDIVIEVADSGDGVPQEKQKRYLKRATLQRGLGEDTA